MYSLTKLRTFYILSFILLLFVFIVSCEDNIREPANEVRFESSEQSFVKGETEMTVKITFTRSVAAGDTITLNVSSEALEYGTDYTTVPPAEGGKLKAPFADGASSLSFVIRRDDNYFPRSGDQVVFSVESLPVGLFLGRTSSATVFFEEITSPKGQANIDMGGTNEPNVVFVDLSANRQKTVDRETWDLACYNGNDADGKPVFRVFLNSPVGMMARPLEKTALNEVNEQDTSSLTVDFSLAAKDVQEQDAEWIANAHKWIDAPDGDLSKKTAIAEVNSDDNLNKVYIVKRAQDFITEDETRRGWKKIRVLRSGMEYEIRYADINDTENYSSTTIARSDTHLFTYMRFDHPGSVVDVAPPTAQWDIAFTTFTVLFPFGASSVPYWFRDVVIQNRGVEAAEVLTSSYAYEAFGEGDLSAISFSGAQDAIGSGWRNIPQGGPGGGQPPPPEVRKDRFYVVRDMQGNVYKLRFTAFARGGERGKPAFEYSLLKEGGTQ